MFRGSAGNRPRAANKFAANMKSPWPPDFRLTPRVHEVRAPLETLAFLGRSNLVEPDEVSGGRRPRTVLRSL